MLDCTSLQSIDIPGSVTIIDYVAFKGCTSLQHINIPDSVTEISNEAFSGCTSLQGIDIPDSVTKIGLWAFENCTSLKSIHIHSGEIDTLDIGDYSFEGVDKDECILYVPEAMKQMYSTHPVFGSFKQIVEE